MVNMKKYVKKLKIRKKISTFQIILLGFASVIIFGALLLMLPISSSSREITPFLDSLFTATSAVCVTGLVVFDTATHWSLFGQIIILLMIQIGGMGFVTVAAAFALVSGRKIGLFERDALKEAFSAPNVGGIVKLTGFIVSVVFVIEFIGAIIMMPVFCRDFGANGVWMAIFHSVSAFCNAGFDIMGNNTGEFSSLTSYSAQPVINLTVMYLVVFGGIGFMVWDDARAHKFSLRKYKTQSKVVLILSGLLIIIPAVYFFFAEFSNLPFGERLFASLFQSVTPRTAGFNTANLTLMKESSLAIIICLMLIGGSPGSTAGGIKTTTVAVLIAAVISVFRKKNDVDLMKRRIEEKTVKNALTIALMYIVLFLLSGIVISAVENLPLFSCLFETASAIGTVGLTLGITPSLGIASKLILIGLMFFGRVGGLTLIYAAIGGSKAQVSKYPIDKITVG